MENTDGFQTLSKALSSLVEWFNGINWEEVATTFNAAVKTHVEAARKLGMKGWTVPAWMGLSDPIELCELSEAELDDRFTIAFTENNFRVLNERIEELSKCPEMANWTPMLMEVRDSIIAGRHLIAVPALLTIIEGYAVTHVLRIPARASGGYNLFKLFEATKLHDADGIAAMPAVSNLMFLQMLFVPLPFDRKPPEHLNRHWVLHGRDDCNWSQADAFRLVNALETLHWVWETRWDK